MTEVTFGFDATHSNIASLPKGAQVAGYVTGSEEVCWTSADWAAHPGAVRIDQSPLSTALDETADVLDVENGAATLTEIVGWARAALANFRAGKRPGQRSPLIYMSQDNVSAVISTLKAGGFPAGAIGLYVADWNFSTTVAAGDIGPTGEFPTMAVQYSSGLDYDFDVFDTAWVNDVSMSPAPLPKPEVQYHGIVLFARPGHDMATEHAMVDVVTYDGKTWV
jgi:hypothetical protein